MTLSEMKQWLAAGKVQLTKSLGQNFLHDRNQLRRILALAEVGPHDRVLEIGPGLGPLTELLVARAGEVLAIEIDRRLFELLRQRFPGTSNLTLVHADALEYLRREARDWSEWKLVANLPYSMASALLVELAQAERGPRRIVATLQLEVAQRLTAKAGEPDYGLLTLLVQFAYLARVSFKIPASCFFPAPDIASACVLLERRPQPLLAPAPARTFTRIIKCAFAQRRKMMLKLLKAEWPAPPLERAFEQLRLSPQVRAEAVSLEQLVALAEGLHNTPA
jgi:16S rRNA (adenine1518-N6/adenine1519-N6)-dimethyltransferase